MQGALRRHFVQRPESVAGKCAMCGECWKYCPARAISRKGETGNKSKDKNKKLEFDYDKCIRCYCCIEVCPHGALKAADTLPGRLLKKLMKR
jgi:formate hydrogenlyase subunit 6/NADH:ubiquinone oxidoreductase subunit I